MEQRFPVHPMIALACLPSSRIVAGGHRGVTGCDQSRFTIQAKIGCGNTVAAIVILQGPGVVTIAMQHGLVVHAVVSHPRYLALSIVNRSVDSYAGPERGRFSIQPYIEGRNMVPCPVVFRI